MNRFLSLIAALAIAVPGVSSVRAEGAKKVSSPLDFKMKDIKGKEVDLSQYKGKVVLFVNVASRCGYTPQYEGLESLYKKYKDQGLVVVGVPANEFGQQEPGSDAEIEQFCTGKYNVTFPMLSKVVVKGQGITPLYQYLTGKDTDPDHAGDIKWNFTKFLVGRDGKVAGRFEPKVEPLSDELTGAVKNELDKK